MSSSFSTRGPDSSPLSMSSLAVSVLRHTWDVAFQPVPMLTSVDLDGSIFFAPLAYLAATLLTAVYFSQLWLFTISAFGVVWLDFQMAYRAQQIGKEEMEKCLKQRVQNALAPADLRMLQSITEKPQAEAAIEDASSTPTASEPETSPKTTATIVEDARSALSEPATVTISALEMNIELAPFEDFPAPVEDFSAPVEDISAPVENISAPVEEIAGKAVELAAVVEEEEEVTASTYEDPTATMMAIMETVHQELAQVLGVRKQPIELEYSTDTITDGQDYAFELPALSQALPILIEDQSIATPEVDEETIIMPVVEDQSIATPEVEEESIFAPEVDEETIAMPEVEGDATVEKHTTATPTFDDDVVTMPALPEVEEEVLDIFSMEELEEPNGNTSSSSSMRSFGDFVEATGFDFSIATHHKEAPHFPIIDDVLKEFEASLYPTGAEEGKDTEENYDDHHHHQDNDQSSGDDSSSRNGSEGDESRPDSPATSVTSSTNDKDDEDVSKIQPLEGDFRRPELLHIDSGLGMEMDDVPEACQLEEQEVEKQETVQPNLTETEDSNLEEIEQPKDVAAAIAAPLLRVVEVRTSAPHMKRPTLVRASTSRSSTKRANGKNNGWKRIPKKARLSATEKKRFLSRPAW